MTATSRRTLVLAGLLALLALPLPATAEDDGSSSDDPPPPSGTSPQSDRPGFGGPNAVENQLR